MVADPAGANITALIAIGMALAFVAIDRHSATSRMLALCLIDVGLAILIDFNWIHRTPVEDLPAWSGLAVLPTVLALMAGAEWVMRVRRTIPTQGLRTRFADGLLRTAQALAVVHGVLAVIFYRQRAEQLFGSFQQGWEALSSPYFYLLSLPFDLALLCVGAAIVLTLNRKPDLPESLRLIGFAAGIPFIAVGAVLPGQWAPYSVVIGEMMILAGALNYHVLQGQRGAFMTRFMAPQVARLVRDQGLNQAIDNRNMELSVVACDLRGFTAYAEAVDSGQVIRALNEYYRVIGAAAARHGATIKDYAGDGVLMLVGAPLPYADHADRAADLALNILCDGEALLARWQRNGSVLGLGVGLASGTATVGVVGDTRLEYAAVGSVVNRAARLCAAAAPGEALCDSRLAELLAPGQRSARLATRRLLNLKGLGDAVPAWLLATDAGRAGATGDFAHQPA